MLILIFKSKRLGKNENHLIRRQENIKDYSLINLKTKNHYSMKKTNSILNDDQNQNQAQKEYLWKTKVSKNVQCRTQKEKF